MYICGNCCFDIYDVLFIIFIIVGNYFIEISWDGIYGRYFVVVGNYIMEIIGGMNEMFDIN